MKHLLTVSCALLLLLAIALPVTATGNGTVADTAAAIADDILAYQLAQSDCDTVQQWAESTLPTMIGAGGEWYALALHRMDASLDLFECAKAIASLVMNGEDGGAVTKQRYALALLATGGGDRYIAETAQSTIGVMGHMSLVFGLHLINNGADSGEMSAEGVIAQILDGQLTDGGWALAGESSDPDVTAMTLQALAPHRDRADVAAAVEAALSRLSEMQLPTGEFVNYGVSCPEGAAQVIVALTSLGLPVEDARFVKNGNTLLDGIVRYRLSDGSFSHVEGGAYNATATVQCFYAMIAIGCAEAGEGALYQLDPPAGVPDLTLPQDEPAQPQEEKSSLWQVIVRAGLLLVGMLLVAWLIYTLCHRCTPKKLVSIALVAVAVIAAVLLVDITPVDEYYDGEHKQKEDPIGRVTITVLCDTAIGKPGTDHLPEDGVLLPETEFLIEEGDTAFSILTEAAAAYGLRVTHTGVTATSSAMAYVTSINDLGEMDHGALSGWKYFVNSKEPSIGCGEYALSDGDHIVFRYTTSLGEDLK